MRRVIRRGAFDIGSGATKLQISDIDIGTSSLVSTIFGQERPCAFGCALMKSENGHLSEAIQDEGLQVIRELKAIGDKHGVESYSAIATEVFRKAKNGQEYLNRLVELNIPVVIVTQAMEAEIGYATAVALSSTSVPSQNIIAWDSGGASFQISSRIEEVGGDRVVPRESSSQLLTYMGALGTSITTSILVEIVRGLKYADTESPNPVSMSEVLALSQCIRERLSPPPEWLENASELTAIGGHNSMFQLACGVLTSLASDTEGPAVSSFTADDIKCALEMCAGKSDKDLAGYVAFDHADPPSVIVPKLTLLYTVMTHARIGRVHAKVCVGSCGGLLISDRFWNDDGMKAGR